jgi:hypothetical protein
MTATNFQDDTATISVLRYFKGSGPATVSITGFGPGALCRSFVQVGDHWIFFAKGDPSALMSASYLSQFDAIAPPSADIIAQIMAALNISPRAFLPLLASGTQIAAATTNAEDQPLTGLLLLAMIIGALWYWQRWLAGRA